MGLRGQLVQRHQRAGDRPVGLSHISSTDDAAEQSVCDAAGGGDDDQDAARGVAGRSRAVVCCWRQDACEHAAAPVSGAERYVAAEWESSGGELWGWYGLWGWKG